MAEQGRSVKECATSTAAAKANAPDNPSGAAKVNEIMQLPFVSMDDVLQVFPFQLDACQKDAIKVILGGESLVVSAPTGSGKTAIAEAATVSALARGKRVIYTTPLKALSNQKLFEFRRLFGTERVGLQTGDGSLNAEGDVVVMTTEVMRNIMYRSAHDAATGRSGSSDRLGDVGLLVLDEVHYLGDPSRGSVWEEVIINCPPHIQLLSMSATIANADDLGAWIKKVHGSCRTLVSLHRPIPLSWQYCHSDGVSTTLQQLLDKKEQRLNPDLAPRAFDDDVFGDPRSVAGARARLQAMLEEQGMVGGSGPGAGMITPSKESVVRKLKAADMLPAIWFIFSRATCDTAVHQMHKAGVSLVTTEERVAIMNEVNKLRKEQSVAIRGDYVPALLQGIASHHAGCLPGWRCLIELLFQRGLLKLVFATETLAAGINMPARSTVLSTVSRRRDDGPSTLTHNELLQMAGRAGRRGFDNQGYCILVHSARDGPSTAADLLFKGPEPLASQFESNYGMTLNLLFSRSLSQARDFVNRSFANYLSSEGRANVQKLIDRWRQQAANYLLDAEKAEAKAGGAESTYQRYETLQARIREVKRTRSAVLAQALTQRSNDAVALLGDQGLPCTAVVELDPRAAAGSMMDQSLVALVVAELDPPVELQGNTSFLSQSWYLCLSADNRLLKIRAEHVSHVGSCRVADQGKASELTMSAAMKAASWQTAQGGVYSAPGPLTTAAVASRIGDKRNLQPLDVAEGFLDSLDHLEEELSGLQKDSKAAKKAAGSKRNEREDIDLRARAARLLKKAKNAARSLEQQEQQQGTWRAFEDVVAVLVAAGALEADTLKAQPLGQVAREVHGGNQLWLAIVLTHNATQDLTAPQLAGLLGAMVAPETASRPHISAAYSPSEAIVSAVEALEPARGRVFHLQAEAGLNFPVEVDLRLAGIVEAWAAGSTWSQVMSDCNLDDGDIARLLSRTIDLLRQAGHCSALLPGLRKAARVAAQAMTRRPITELVS
ncbi:hypothetical protein WJX73_009621 [Symbiochloris irregularis]|uniref:Uncharacterized protein n=1 Tax=Symbiochloris irregularis TaxID=706552 RepID=A0AAW1PZX2_9CHLO